MIKKILIVFAIFCFSSIHAQYDEWTPAKIILKNGTSFRGLVKLPTHSGVNLSSEGTMSLGSNKVQYKKNRKSPKKKYGSDTLDEVIFGDEEFTTVHYKFIPIKKNKSVIMELIVRGNVSLYKANSFENPKFYLIRHNEQVARLFIDSNNSRTFISRAKKYFSDCKNIVYYLESELYSFDNLIELVEDYNLLCE